MRGHRGDEQVRGSVQRSDRDTLTPQIGDAANAFMPEQPEAADMHAGQHRNRDAAIDCGRQRRGKIHRKVERTAADGLRHVAADLSPVVDIGEALRAQQLASD